MARAVELDRPPLPDVGARGWSMMRRGITTPASDRWQEVREVAREFRTQAREWLERSLDRVQERTAALGLTRVPETALERPQAARAWRAEDRSVEMERNVESAGHALTQQDRERERALERQRAAEREGSSHSR